jgi:hypothetical protein
MMGISKKAREAKGRADQFHQHRSVMNHPREWFQPKVVGIGWSPRTWEGWAVILSVIAIGAVVGRVNL